MSKVNLYKDGECYSFDSFKDARDFWAGKEGYDVSILKRNGWSKAVPAAEVFSVEISLWWGRGLQTFDTFEAARDHYETLTQHKEEYTVSIGNDRRGRIPAPEFFSN